MEKEFIPYEQALALKELGFDESCMYVFDKQRNNLMCPIYGLFENDEPDRFLNAPLYQQAFRWFREKYGMKFHIRQDIWNHWCSVTMILKDDEYTDIEDYETYEEAELECLKKLIEIVKKKK